MHLQVPDSIQKLFSERGPIRQGDSRGDSTAWTDCWFSSQVQNIKRDDVFIAHQGLRVDGHDFFREALERGAGVLIGQKPSYLFPGYVRSRYLQVEDTRAIEAYFSTQYFLNPSQSLRLYGVTGTSGKTTNTYLFRSCLERAERKVGLIGTVEISIAGKTVPAEYTTPNAFELNRIFYEMKQSGCTDVVMEVSSHALKQRRTAFLAFDGVWFTNLSPEHLDYHPDMKDYYESKKLLFSDYLNFSASVGKKPFAVVNLGDSYGSTLFEELQNHSQKGRQLPVSIYGFILKNWTGVGSINRRSIFDGSKLRIGLDGVHGMVEGPIPFAINSHLVGNFNAENLMGAGAVAALAGFAPQIVSEGLTQLQHVPGRLDKVDISSGGSQAELPSIFVDYAHKPDALEKVLVTLKKMNPRRIITVFGCGGDRDSTKRPLMGKIAQDYSDWVIITSDNPRTEDPLKIIDAILSGTSGLSEKIAVEPERKRAIEMAVEKLEVGDVLLIAGKGHESYQIIRDPSQPKGTRKIDFDDKAVALSAWQELR